MLRQECQERSVGHLRESAHHPAPTTQGVVPCQTTFLRYLQVLPHDMEGYWKVSVAGVWQGGQGPELWEESPALSPELSVLGTPQPQSLHLSSERAEL